MKFYKILDFDNELQNIFDTIMLVEDKNIKEKLENRLSELEESISTASKQIRKAVELLETL